MSSHSQGSGFTYPDPIPDLIPFGSICTLSGASGTGKTRMVAGWLKRLTLGQSICLHPTNPPAAIGIIAVDRRWSEYAKLFHLIGLPDIPHFSFRDLSNFPWQNFKTQSGRIAALRQALDFLQLPPGSLVFCDPLSLFVTNKLMDYAEVAIGMSAIDAELKSRHLTLIGAFHTHKVYANKMDRTLRPQDRILGSGAQIAFTDTSIYLASPAEMDAPYFELGFIPHNAKAEQHHFTMTEDGLFVPYEPEGTTSPKDRLDMLLQLIPDEGISTGDLQDQFLMSVVVSRATFFRDLKTLDLQGKVRQEGRGLIKKVTPS